ncbi:MAG: hypothetical protein ACKO96_02205, partial [Flammeovirgaceae bacterium]
MKKLYTLLFLSAALFGNAQSILEKKITISLIDEKIPDALAKLSKEGNFSFSYNSSILSREQLVTLYAFDRTLREVLDEIFKGTVQYKEKGKYLILKKAATATKNSQVIVRGFIEDLETGKKIENASVYDKHSITSVVTDEIGFFQLKLDKNSDSIRFVVSKKKYFDTLVSLPAHNYNSLKIQLRSKTITAIDLADTIRKEKT